MSILGDTLVKGVVTQQAAATDPTQLIRLGEAKTLLLTIFQGPWNNTATFQAGQMVSDDGATYVANVTSLNQKPTDNPSVWRLAAAAGADGANSFVYLAYASDASGTGFSRTPASGLIYVGILVTETAIANPAASDFVGLWVKFIGADGNPGAPGGDGDDGASAFIYVGYASDTSGTGYSASPASGLNYIAFRNSTVAIASPVAADFAGLWKLYANPFTVSAPLTLTGNVLAVNAASASTANFLVQRDGSGNFAANAITAASLVIGGSATVTVSGGALNVNVGLVATALTVGSLSGVLKAATGVVAGGATTDDLTEGTTNQYYTMARVRSTTLTGISSTNVLLATDTVLVAFGKIDHLLGGNYASGTVTGNFTITGALAVSGQTTLATTLNGVLKASSGVVAAAATTDDLPIGSTNFYWTQALFNTAIAAIKNANNGIAPLDSSGKVPLANSYVSGATPYGAASQSAMLALSAKQGDVCLRSDTNIAYMLSNNTPTVLSNWSAWVYPVMSVNGATGTVVLKTDNVAEGTTNLYYTDARVDSRITANWKGAANGLCPLDANSLVPATNLPPIGDSIWIVNTQTAQTNLSSALKGDIANRTDQNISYVLGNNTPGTFASWVPLLYPVSSVNGATGTVVLTTANVAEGSNLYFLASRVLSSTLTGFAAGGGTVSATDTVLTALQKVAANAAANLPLSGGALTGPLTFSGTTNRGLVVNQLSTAQITALAATSGFYGTVVYDNTLNQLKALVNGSWVSLASGASLPLAAGNGSPLTGTLYFQDGLSSFMQLGNIFSMRVSNSDANLDFLNSGTVVLTCDSSNNVKVPNGSFSTPNGYSLTISGTPTPVLYLNSSIPVLNLGGSFTLTTESGYASLVLGNAGGGMRIDTSNNVTLPALLKMGSNKVIDTSNYYYDASGNQILAGRQGHFAVASLTGTYGSDYGNLSSWMTQIQSVLQTHGLMASS